MELNNELDNLVLYEEERGIESNHITPVDYSIWHYPDSFNELVDGLNQAYKKIDFHGCEIKAYEFPQLYQALKNNKELQHFAMEGNMLGVSGSEAVANALVSNSTLVELYIEANDIRDEGTSLIANAIRMNSTLKELYLRYNNIGPEGAKHIGNALKENASLHTISLRGNIIGPQGAKWLAQALTVNRSVSTLSLRDNEIGPSGAKYLAESLKKNESLTEIFLEANGISDEGAKAFLQMMNQNKSLTYIDLQNNSVSAGLLKRINQNLEEIKRLQRASYFEALNSKSKVPWRRSKLMVVGEGGSGKTATVRSLLNKNFIAEWNSTVGVALTETTANSNSVWSENARANFAARFVNREGAKIYRTKGRLKPRNESLPKAESMPNMDGVIDHGRSVGSSRTAPGENDPERPRLSNYEISNKNGSLYGFEKQRFSKAALEVDSIRLSIWDYGGQSVFYALHHIFLTEYGVYLLVFNPKMYLKQQEETESYLKFWLQSIKLHALNAPVFMVATFALEMDRKGCTRINRMLSKILVENPQIIKNGDVSFFLVDNRTKYGIKILRKALEDTILRQEYVNTKVSLQWMQILDESIEVDEAWLSLKMFKEIGMKYGLTSSSELEDMLRLFHELGVLLHFTSTENLRNLIITKPDWLVSELSKVIRDPALHNFDKTEIVEVGLKVDADLFFQTGIISRDLLEFFWSHKQVEFLLDMLRSLFLLSKWKFRDQEEKYLVPSMIRNNVNSSKEHELASSLSCEIRFDYLPTGVFERLVCLCVDYSSRYSDEVEQPMLERSFCKVWFEESYELSLQLRGETQILIQIKNPRFAAQCMTILRSMLHKLNNDSMGSKLVYDLMVPSSGKMIPLERARKIDPLWSMNVDDARVTLSKEIDAFLDSF